VTPDTSISEYPPVKREVSAETEVVARRLRHLSEIGLALSAERDIRRLLAMILSTSRELTLADGGTLYIIEKLANGDSVLNFRASQNDSIIVDTNMSFAVAPTSLAGYAAFSGQMLAFDDVYNLAPEAPYKFNPLFDFEHGYRTKSVLVVPLKNHNGEVIGVLQLINRKRRREVILRDPAIVESEVVGFDDEMIDLAATLASQAAVALDNNLLLREIESLFEAFVVAASSAIEDRDPSTSGHSQRVTRLTIELARAIHETNEGPFKSVRFTPAQMKELRYATLLHDFGKIGVREAVLTKSHKIEPNEFAAIKNRMLALRRQREAAAYKHKVDFLQSEGLPPDRLKALLEEVDKELEVSLELLDDDMAQLDRINDPAAELLPEEAAQGTDRLLERLANTTYLDEYDRPQPLLRPQERHALGVRRGSLTPEEYLAIQHHAQLSFEFLRRIPWTQGLKNIPEIAHAHHERNDGTGYPMGLKDKEIPFAAKIMAIADVYDALTASDRPYKRAMSPERALEILRYDAAGGKVDKDALEIFIARGIYKLTEPGGADHLHHH